MKLQAAKKNHVLESSCLRAKVSKDSEERRLREETKKEGKAH